MKLSSAKGGIDLFTGKQVECYYITLPEDHWIFTLLKNMTIDIYGTKTIVPSTLKGNEFFFCDYEHLPSFTYWNANELKIGWDSGVTMGVPKSAEYIRWLSDETNKEVLAIAVENTDA